MLPLRADVHRSKQFEDHRLFSALERDRTRYKENSEAILVRKCASGLSPDRLGLTLFFTTDEQRIPEPGLALQVKRVRDDAKKRKAAANTLRRNWKAPFAPM